MFYKDTFSWLLPRMRRLPSELSRKSLASRSPSDSTDRLDGPAALLRTADGEVPAGVAEPDGEPALPLPQPAAEKTSVKIPVTIIILISEPVIRFALNMLTAPVL
jgi:hypothetical protein